MTDVIECSFDIGVQDILGLVSDDNKDRSDRIMTGTSRAKSVAVGFEFAFPCWLKRKLDEGLLRPCLHHGNTKRALFRLPWLRNVYSSHRLGFLPLPLVRVNVFNHDKSKFRMDRFDSIYPCCLLPLVILSHSSHRYQPCRSGLHQQFLEFVDCSCVATLFGLEDAFLYAINMLFQLAPGEPVPTFTRWVKRRLPFALRCLRMCHTTRASSFHIIVPTSAYPAAFLLAFASFLGNPALKCIGWNLLALSTRSKSFLESCPVPVTRFASP